MADVAQDEIELVRMALRERAHVFHLQLVALLAEARQHQPVDVQIGDLTQHGDAALFGQLQKVRAYVQLPLPDADVYQNRTVGNMEFRTFGVAVFRAEFRVQVIEQQSERFEVFALVIVVDSLLIGLRIDFALRGVQYRSDE